MQRNLAGGLRPRFVLRLRCRCAFRLQRVGARAAVERQRSDSHATVMRQLRLSIWTNAPVVLAARQS
jgi:hypothetical protein